MKGKLSVVFALLMGLAVAMSMLNEQSQAEPTAAGLAPALVVPMKKPGAPIEQLLEAHNRYLERSGKPELRAPRSVECSDRTLVSWGPIDLADKR